MRVWARNGLKVGLAGLTLLVVAWLFVWNSTGEYYTYYSDSGRITYTTIVSSPWFQGRNTVPTDGPEAREACAKESAFFLVRPIRVLLYGEIPCYHVAGR